MLEEIGSGGMATVYKAMQEPLNRMVAIKALKPHIALSSHFGIRFEREARFLASMHHENILPVYDLIRDDNNLYIVMEYIEGINVYDILKGLQSPLPVDVAAIIALQVARALDYAHFRNVIHRDIKPANVMLSWHGDVKLMDFGIARDEIQSELTQTGTGLGTPAYMSPEQILGDAVDFRSDLFSLGIVLYQMVTGQKPFKEEAHRSVMQKIRLDGYIHPRRINRDIPRSLETILKRCMAKLPAHRYLTTQALIDALSEFLSQRVPGNYNLRLVRFLRDSQLLEQERADRILATSSVGSPGRTWSSKWRVSRLKKSAYIALASLGLGLLIGTGINAFHAQATGTKAQGLSEAKSAGHLRVVSNPWAEVWLNKKQRLLTTPSAQAITLPPGTHALELRNPNCQSIQRSITIKPQQTHWLRVELPCSQNASSKPSN